MIWLTTPWRWVCTAKIHFQTEEVYVTPGSKKPWNPMWHEAHVSYTHSPASCYTFLFQAVLFQGILWPDERFPTIMRSAGEKSWAWGCRWFSRWADKNQARLPAAVCPLLRTFLKGSSKEILPECGNVKHCTQLHTLLGKRNMIVDCRQRFG